MDNHKTFLNPENDKYLFLDMNSFFARCEQQLNPALQGKPVVIAPYTGNTGCCIAVSSEAKLYGIKTGFGVGQARKLYPQVQVIEARPHIYRQFHHKIVEVVGNFTPDLMVRSIDEMTFLLSSYERGADRPKKLALQIKQKLAQEIGKWMTCSIGVGPNIFWAKQGAEEQKPDGLTIIRQSDFPKYLQKWKLTDIKGIAHNMERIFNQAGICSPFEIYQTKPEQLRRKLKMGGEYWWLRLHGYNIDTAPTKRGHIGHSCVLPPEARNWKTATQVMQKLVERAGERLRKENYQGRGIIVHIRYLGDPSWHRYLKTSPFFDSLSFWEMAKVLWEQAPKRSKPLLIAVTAVNLSKKSALQLELFPNRQKNINIFNALDLINNRFGKWTLKPASLIGADDLAPSRIPFGNTQL